MKKILIAGGTGLLGFPTAKRMEDEGFEVSVLTRLPEKYKEQFAGSSILLIKGDVADKASLKDAMKDKDGVHISVAGEQELEGTKNIVEVAKEINLKKISYVSGATVCEENRWFPMIDNKYKGEQEVINCGIPYSIFRPTWFFESLSWLVRDGKASVLGKQNHPYHFVAAGDFANMICNSFKKEEANNKIFYIHGPEKMLMLDALTKYCAVKYPDIKKVSVAPLGQLRLIAFLTGKKQLKFAVKLFAYFEKVDELGDPSEANEILGKPELTLTEWLKSKN
jgi:uncharacterized protein YbjT (DUF2867 family)